MRVESGRTVQIISLSKHYGSFAAVDEVSLTAGSGEFVALLGPSGSGKTTLLMSIAGFEQPSSGDIVIDGRSCVDIEPNRRNIGMVFQRYALFPHMTVGENVAFPLRMRRASKADIAAKVAEALEMVRLPGMADRKPSQLSGGQQQRVALARAIVFGPPVLLMDEPLGALDKALRTEMQLEIKSLQRRIGATVIYITHDQEEALAMADRIGVMRAGKLEQFGRPQDLYQRPQNRFVASFIGDMNFLAGRVRRHDPDGTTVVLAHEDAVVRVRSAGFDLREGQEVEFGIRPEHVVPSDERGLAGTVTEATYLGSIYHYQVALADGTAMSVRSAAGATRGRLAVGETVRLAWAGEDACLFPRA